MASFSLSTGSFWDLWKGIEDVLDCLRRTCKHLCHIAGKDDSYDSVYKKIRILCPSSLCHHMAAYVLANSRTTHHNIQGIGRSTSRKRVGVNCVKCELLLSVDHSVQTQEQNLMKRPLRGVNQFYQDMKHFFKVQGLGCQFGLQNPEELKEDEIFWFGGTKTGGE